MNAILKTSLKSGIPFTEEVTTTRPVHPNQHRASGASSSPYHTTGNRLVTTHRRSCIVVHGAGRRVFYLHGDRIQSFQEDKRSRRKEAAGTLGRGGGEGRESHAASGERKCCVGKAVWSATDLEGGAPSLLYLPLTTPALTRAVRRMGEREGRGGGELVCMTL